MGLVMIETGIQEKDTSVLRALEGGTKRDEDTGNFFLKKKDKDVVQEAHLLGENKLQWDQASYGVFVLGCVEDMTKAGDIQVKRNIQDTAVTMAEATTHTPRQSQATGDQKEAGEWDKQQKMRKEEE